MSSISFFVFLFNVTTTPEHYTTLPTLSHTTLCRSHLLIRTRCMLQVALVVVCLLLRSEAFSNSAQSRSIHLQKQRFFHYQPLAPVQSYAVCRQHIRSEEHPYALKSLMRISYAVFCLKKKTYK